MIRKTLNWLIKKTKTTKPLQGPSCLQNPIWVLNMHSRPHKPAASVSSSPMTLCLLSSRPSTTPLRMLSPQARDPCSAYPPLTPTFDMGTFPLVHSEPSLDLASSLVPLQGALLSPSPSHASILHHHHHDHHTSCAPSWIFTVCLLRVCVAVSFSILLCFIIEMYNQHITLYQFRCTTQWLDIYR